jgi:hypothetical protein
VNYYGWDEPFDTQVDAEQLAQRIVETGDVHAGIDIVVSEFYYKPKE